MNNWFIKILVEGFVDIIRVVFARPEEARVVDESIVSPVVPQISLETKETPADALCTVAKRYLGKDASPRDEVSDAVACVSSLVKVLSTTTYALPKDLVSTVALANYLKKSQQWRSSLTPKSGSIIISPTVSTTNRGHCGLFLTNSRIASNNSANGLWEDNYSFQNWISYFKTKKGLRIFIFEPI